MFFRRVFGEAESISGVAAPENFAYRPLQAIRVVGGLVSDEDGKILRGSVGNQSSNAKSANVCDCRGCLRNFAMSTSVTNYQFSCGDPKVSQRRINAARMPALSKTRLSSKILQYRTSGTPFKRLHLKHTKIIFL